MNAVGIDVSKGKSMAAVMQPLGVVSVKPFEVHHTAEALENLGYSLQGLPSETRIIMEHIQQVHSHLLCPREGVFGLLGKQPAGLAVSSPRYHVGQSQ